MPDDMKLLIRPTLNFIFARLGIGLEIHRIKYESYDCLQVFQN